MEIFKYNEVTRKPNPLKNFYALDKKKDTIRSLTANIEPFKSCFSFGLFVIFALENCQ